MAKLSKYSVMISSATAETKGSLRTPTTLTAQES
jgi:hypothetical protein